TTAAVHRYRGAAQAARRAHALPPPEPGAYAVPMATDTQQISGPSGPADGDGSVRARILADVTALRDSFGAGTTRPLDARLAQLEALRRGLRDRKSTRLNSSHVSISYAVFCLKKK